MKFGVVSHLPSVLGATATKTVIAAVSLALSPHDWTAWGRLLARGGRHDHALPVRVLIGAILAIVAGRIGRPWLLAPAVLIAAPVIHGLGIFSILSTLPRLVRSRDDLEDRRARPMPDQPVGAGPG